MINKPLRRSSSTKDNNHVFMDNYDKLHKIVEFNSYITKGKHTVLLINDSLLGSDSQSVAANHWIVGVKPLCLINGDIITDNSNLALISSKEIKFECFSWGTVGDISYFRKNYNAYATRNNKKTINISITLKQFMDCFYESMIFENIL
ncbi:hypothetical protein QB833_004560 [Salmonella enterica]|nr:hypothetical protein [Salmonella enterica]